MATTATLITADPPGWAPVTKHYRTEDSKDFAITVYGGIPPSVVPLIDQALAESGAPSLISGQHQIVAEPTTVVSCNADGTAIELTPIATFPSGTSHENALVEMGYEVQVFNQQKENENG